MKDKKLQAVIKKEVARQQNTLDLIPSENIASPDILAVLGSPLTNKYSEGYPGKRYYPGNEYYDEIEKLAQERALKAFGLNPEEWSVNVQPYSGSPANLAIYSALMKLGDVLMGMKLAAGGHLTHGHKVSFSGQAWRAVQYGVNETTGLLDYEEMEKLASEQRPKVIVSGATAYPREIDFERIGKIAKSVGAYHVADISHIAGLVLADLHPSPFPYSDVVMMTTHKTLRGPRGAVIFSRKFSIFIPSGHLPQGDNFSAQMGEARSAEAGRQFSISEAIDKAVFPGMQGGPHNNVTAAKALMFFEAMRPEFKKYQQQIVKNAAALAEALSGLGFNLVTGGTDNHLMLLDLRSTGLDGMTAEKMLEENGIIANRNSIPGDTKPLNPSGVRMGTPALTTRGMKEKEMRLIAELIHDCLVKKQNVRKEVAALCKKFPL